VSIASVLYLTGTKIDDPMIEHLKRSPNCSLACLSAETEGFYLFSVYYA